MTIGKTFNEVTKLVRVELIKQGLYTEEDGKRGGRGHIRILVQELGHTRTGGIAFDQEKFDKALHSFIFKYGAFPGVPHSTKEDSEKEEKFVQIDWKTPEAKRAIKKITDAINSVIDRCIDTKLVPPARTGRGGSFSMHA